MLLVPTLLKNRPVYSWRAPGHQTAPLCEWCASRQAFRPPVRGDETHPRNKMHTRQVTVQASSSETVIEHRHCLRRRTGPLELTLNAFGERVNGNISCRCEFPGNLQSPWTRDPQPRLQRQEWDLVMIRVISLLLSVRTLQGAPSGFQNSEAQQFPEAKLYSTARIRSVSGPRGAQARPTCREVLCSQGPRLSRFSLWAPRHSRAREHPLERV